MQRAPTEFSEQRPQSTISPASLASDPDRNHGSCQHLCPGPVVRPGSRDVTPRSVDGDALDEQQLRALSVSDGCSALGQEISDGHNYHASVPGNAVGVDVVSRHGASSGTQLADFPNEVLTHILSHLHPDSHAAVALASRRFHALVNSPHAWREAFLRFFAGHTILADADGRVDASLDLVRADTRFFGRLTPLAGWRSEYLLRTRLIRCLTQSKPGSSSPPARGRTATKHSAVLTYNSKLPGFVTSIHAVFSNGQKPPRAIHGAGDVGVATVSDPTTGKVEKWSLEGPLTAAQLHTAALPSGLDPESNVMDVSLLYGSIVGEGFPGGRAYFQGVNEMSGRYLGSAHPSIPQMPQAPEAICSVWIAKSSAVPATTQSTCGMLTGSMLGVVTAYSLGGDPAGPRNADGDMTARWVVSPGVPITSLKVDDSYSPRRKSASRVWAVALNALGEVFYLTETPAAAAARRATGDDVLQRAWLAGQSAPWRLVEATLRVARPDGPAACGPRAPCSPSSGATRLGGEQLAAEALEMGRLMRLGPAHLRRQYEGWDMQRRLEVDFAADDGNGAGEGIIVLESGLEAGRPARVSRWSRSTRRDAAPASPHVPEPTWPSLFAEPTTDSRQSAPQSRAQLHNWCCTSQELRGHEQAVISASGMDCSAHSLLTLAEDPLHVARQTGTASASPEDGSAAGEIPGRRARLVAAGTKDGAIVIWNARQRHQVEGIGPLRIIQTDSPEITTLAASALYLVHGGSDGLVQAWDPLASTTDPIRTINARPSGHTPRYAAGMNPAPPEVNHTAARALYLDADPTVLRGVVSFGVLLRYWSYSSASRPTGRRRRPRHSDMHGGLASRRLGGTVSGYIAAEEAELRREKEQQAREQARLQRRFGALGDLTEEEAVRYAQMVSEEAYQQSERRRRASDPAADAGLETASSLSETTAETVTPEASVTDAGSQPRAPADDGESELERQFQQALRLSLLEAADGGGGGQASQGGEPAGGDFGYPITYKARGNRRGKRRSSASASASASPPTRRHGGPSREAGQREEDGNWDGAGDGDEALAVALSLSMADQAPSGSSPSAPSEAARQGLARDEFPPLDGEGGGGGWGLGGR